MNTSIEGSGTLNDGSAQFNLTDLNVRINGDMCRITLTNDRQQRFEMTGTFRHESNRCIINSSNRGSTSANALILTDGNRVTGVDVSGNVNGQNFQSNFRARRSLHREAIAAAGTRCCETSSWCQARRGSPSGPARGWAPLRTCLSGSEAPRGPAPARRSGRL